MSKSIWRKKQVTSSSCQWLRRLHPASRLAWECLLDYVKTYGRAGHADIDLEEFLRFAWLDSWGPEVYKMFAAGTADGAITVSNGDNALPVFVDGAVFSTSLAFTVSITNWDKYQSDPTAKERQARFKSAKNRRKISGNNGGNNGGNAFETLEERRVEESRGDKKNILCMQKKAPLSASGQPAMFAGETPETPPAPKPKTEKPRRLIIPPEWDWVEEYAGQIGLPIAQARMFFDHHAGQNWRRGNKIAMSDWQACLRTWQANYTGGRYANSSRTQARSGLIQDQATDSVGRLYGNQK